MKKCSVFGSFAFSLTRLFWSTQQIQEGLYQSHDLSNGFLDAGDSAKNIGKKLGLEEDEDASPYYVDPRDPYTVLLSFFIRF